MPVTSSCFAARAGWCDSYQREAIVKKLVALAGRWFSAVCSASSSRAAAPTTLRHPRLRRHGSRTDRSNPYPYTNPIKRQGSSPAELPATAAISDTSGRPTPSLNRRPSASTSLSSSSGTTCRRRRKRTERSLPASRSRTTTTSATAEGRSELLPLASRCSGHPRVAGELPIDARLARDAQEVQRAASRG